MNEVKITLDTNLLIYLFDLESDNLNAQKSCSLMKTILETQKSVSVDIQISTALEDDFLQDGDHVRREKILSRIRNIFQQVSPGKLIEKDGNILPEDASDQAFFEELKRILFPSLDPSSNNYINNVNDLKHIFSHTKNERDIYVTNDNNFLKESKKKALVALDVNVMSPENLIEYLESYSDKDTYEYKSAPVRHDYRNKDLQGVCEMNFTNNDGLYTIGNGNFIFEIKWGECNHERMRVCNDPRTIESVAIAEGKKFKEVVSEKFYDFTSRFREPRRKKDILIFKNSKNYYAAVKVIDFKVKDRGGDQDYLKFEFKINTSAKCNFKI